MLLISVTDLIIYTDKLTPISMTTNRPHNIDKFYAILDELVNKFQKLEN